MDYEKLYIYDKYQGNDKTYNLQLLSKNKEKLELFLLIFHRVNPYDRWAREQFKEYAKYEPLHLFLQEDSNSDNWKMLEAWSDNINLFLDFCIFVSELLRLPLEFGE